ncbi:MAG: DUF523 domain-containing protein [Erysipelotrichales bacterium]|nr:DUF523 domain-containing protein [Erysipelotrichales bacterium]MBQ1506638.1 DUF523 domain-containing protein [Erysipelotrichales bacterium]
MKKTWIISACLLGIPCRYDGKACPVSFPEELLKNVRLIPVCPEMLGGLPSPRTPSEIKDGRVFYKTGEDVTEYFRKGAEETLRIAKEQHVTCALLKQNSPSCGYGLIYDGTFGGRLIPGKGITAGLLEENGIRIITEDSEF